MQTQEHTTIAVDFRSVYLSDLNKLVKIYKKIDKQPTSCFIEPSFGLPLIVATQHNEIIGFSSVSINALGTLEIQTYWQSAVAYADMEQSCLHQAKKAFKATFGDLENNNNRLTYAINRLLIWLNSAYN